MNFSADDVFRVLSFLIPCPSISSVILTLNPKRVILIAVTFRIMKAAPSELNSQQKSLREKLLRLALIGDNLLEVLVLEFAVLTGALDHHVSFRDLRIQRRNRLRELIDVSCQIRNLGLKRLDVALLHLSFHFILVERLNAEVLHLDIVGLLLLQVGDLANCS